MIFTYNVPHVCEDAVAHLQCTAAKFAQDTTHAYYLGYTQAGIFSDQLSHLNLTTRNGSVTNGVVCLRNAFAFVQRRYS